MSDTTTTPSAAPLVATLSEDDVQRIAVAVIAEVHAQASADQAAQTDAREAAIKEAAAQTPGLGASAPYAWADLNADQKFERMRDMVKTQIAALDSLHQAFNNAAQSFREHRHMADGSPVVPVDMALSNSYGSQLATGAIGGVSTLKEYF
jgi:hypothetical protein